jgi:hypothetical protein
MTAVERALKDAEAQGERTYAEGVAAGFKVALTLVLGKPYGAAVPMPGELEPEQEQWALDALARLEEGTS